MNQGLLLLDRLFGRKHVIAKQRIPSKEQMRQRDAAVKIKLQMLNEKNGLKQFGFEDGYKCWAINEFNALRKHGNYLGYNGRKYAKGILSNRKKS